MVESCGLSRSFNVRDHLTTDFNNCQFTTLRTLEWYKHNPQTICGLPILQRFIAKQKRWVGVSTFGNVSSESLEERAEYHVTPSHDFSDTLRSGDGV